MLAAGLGDGCGIFQDVVDFPSRASEDVVADAEIPKKLVRGQFRKGKTVQPDCRCVNLLTLGEVIGCDFRFMMVWARARPSTEVRQEV